MVFMVQALMHNTTQHKVFTHVILDINVVMPLVSSSSCMLEMAVLFPGLYKYLCTPTLSPPPAYNTPPRSKAQTVTESN